jgi:hypothetical protein
MRVPLDGVVEWLLPDGAKPYWRGRLTHLVYDVEMISDVRRRDGATEARAYPLEPRPPRR